MRHLWLLLPVFLSLTACTGGAYKRSVANTNEPHNPNAYTSNHGDDLAPGDKAAELGRDIWIKSTVGNSRFFAYTFPQRVAGKSINWPDMLKAEQKTRRFYDYGLINDPDCCSPSVAGECEQKFGRRISAEETYGFDYCPGDEDLLRFVGKAKGDLNQDCNNNPNSKGCYRDPACDIKNDISDKNRENSCNLDYGTSTGTVGLRKFPNPRFNAEAWRKAGGWNGYINMSKDANGLAAVDDFALEPPFRVGMACAHCHVSFLPTNPPANPSFPKWENLNSLVGNQYLQDGQIWGSGFAIAHISSQSLSMSRPGTVDTSAVPNDFSGNPGTQNAIINFIKRPAKHPELVNTWRKVASCPSGDEDRCWCEPGKAGKCWQKSAKLEKVAHVLKGGEDSVGYPLAVQRVYFNIGSCSEQCWLNNLTNVLALDPRERNYDQTPFNIGQCRRDCPQFRAMEDRVGSVIQFFLNARPTDMKNVKNPETGTPAFSGDRAQLKTWLENEAYTGSRRAGFGAGATTRGAALFANKCASCHSSQAGSPAVAAAQNPEDYFLREEKDPIFNGKTVRTDWMGNDRLTEVTAIRNNSCRARHSNHMKGKVYDEFASTTYQGRAPLATRPRASGGRGYFRNISLLSVWAHAPFMHNNAVGPELCGDPSNPRWPYGSFTDGRANSCRAFDPSFNERFKLFVDSSREMLTPSVSRVKRAMLTSEAVEIELVPTFWKGNFEKGKNNSISMKFEKGMNAQKISSFKHKEFAGDLVRYLSEARGMALSSSLANLRISEEFKTSLKGRFGPEKAEQILENFAATARSFARQGLTGDVVNLDRGRFNFYLDTYTNCIEEADNLGHDFGTELSEQDKNDLIAFMALL
jgi:hypothetical protein